MTPNLPHHKILLTGCGSSFGAYMRGQLLDQGHEVFGVGLDGPDSVLDLRDTKTVEASVYKIFNLAARTMGGPVTALINNAGMTHLDFTPDHSTEKFLDVMAVNVTAPFIFAKEFLTRVEGLCELQPVEGAGGPPPLPPNGLYRLLSTSTMGTQLSLRASHGYCASKSGLEALTKLWAKEYAGRYPVVVAAIAPSGIDDTQMKRQCIDELQRTRGMSAANAEAYFTQAPLGRNCSQDEVWKMYDFALNQLPEAATGTILRMPGGLGL